MANQMQQPRSRLKQTFFLTLLLLVSPAAARDLGQWNAGDPSIRAYVICLRKGRARLF